MIILAAGQGSRLRPLTDDRPKCLVPLLGRPLLEWQLEVASRCGISDVVVVGGYRADQLRGYPCRLVVNEEFAETNMVHSLFRAASLLEDDVIVSYGDIVYSPEVLGRLMQTREPISVVVDRHWQGYWESRFERPLDDAESLSIANDGRIVSIGQSVGSVDDIDGQYIGLLRFQGPGLLELHETHRYLRQQATGAGVNPPGRRATQSMYMTDLLQVMIDAGHRLAAIPIERGWFEVDSPSDLAIAEAHWAALPGRRTARSA